MNTKNNTPKLIIVSGSCASGKSTLARRIARKFNLPLIMKDEIKEMLFDILGVESKEESKKFSKVAVEMIYTMMEKFLKIRQSCVVESNFRKRSIEAVVPELLKKYEFLPIQVICHCSPETASKRFKKRTRHKGHFDHLIINETERLFPKNAGDFFDLAGERIRINTDSFGGRGYKDGYERVVKMCREQKLKCIENP